ncbi:hypothetical protein [Roseateles sp.]|uniref:hypothetical protein n=1 Tax=Roseateles sp. TaxID=1971397 RepID=UPI0032660D19
MKYSIYRFNPEQDRKPYIGDGDRVLLDVAHTTRMNCTEVCPKGLAPPQAIESIRLTMAGVAL